jgi:hypothetical protein
MREFAGALRTARAEHQGMPYVAKRAVERFESRLHGAFREWVDDVDEK